MNATATENGLSESYREILKRAGNPFRNYFARNPDDEVCARYHVPELFAAERDLLHSIIDLYRYDPLTHSEVVPVLGNKGAGKTHLLHSIKHGLGGQWQLLVTPGVYQRDTDFLEYLLFQIIGTLLGGGKQKGVRPLEYVGDHTVVVRIHQPVDIRLDFLPQLGDVGFLVKRRHQCGKVAQGHYIRGDIDGPLADGEIGRRAGRGGRPPRSRPRRTRPATRTRS